jgi:hypothetical protein
LDRRVIARPAYTLLEVLLASTIGVLLMGALYVAVDVQLRHAKAGRELVERSTLVRAVMRRIANDITSSMAPPTPAPTSGVSAAAAQASAGGSTGAGGTTNSASSSTGAGAGASSPSASSTPGSSTTTNAVPLLNLGVQGSSSQLVLTVSQVPNSPNTAVDLSGTNGAPGSTDLRRIAYWLAGATDSPGGLARQEVLLVSSDEAPPLPPNIADELSMVFADEVKSLTFSYWDGASWQDNWDGTAAGSDGVTPKGPPAAIAVTIGIPAPGASTDGSGLKQYRHVIEIPTANGTSSSSSTTTTSTSP